MFRATDVDDTISDLAELPVWCSNADALPLTSQRPHQTGSSAAVIFSVVVHRSRRTCPSYDPVAARRNIGDAVCRG